MISPLASAVPDVRRCTVREPGTTVLHRTMPQVKCPPFLPYLPFMPCHFPIFAPGEYIAVEKLENDYKACPLVEQIWVYGNSFERCGGKGEGGVGRLVSGEREQGGG